MGTESTGFKRDATALVDAAFAGLINFHFSNANGIRLINCIQASSLNGSFLRLTKEEARVFYEKGTARCDTVCGYVCC